ncbi:MAG TPA: hypothetical protein VF635_07305 [Propionibacteriaceae bacterium]
MTTLSTSRRMRSRSGRPYTRDLTEDQVRSYSNLSIAIADAIDGGRAVPCIRIPALFDRVEQETGGRPAEHGVQGIRRNLCASCPVIEQCRAYVDSGVQVHGFVAGAWRHG